MGLIQAEFDNLNVSQSDYTTFVEAIPFQVYAILAIVMIPLVAFTKKDFSQMKKAETETAAQEYSFENDMQGQTGKDGQVYGTSNAKPVMVIVPIIVVFATLFITLDPWKHDQRPRYGRIYCKRIKEYEFLGRTGACVNGVITFAAFIFAGFTRSPLAAALAVVILLAVMMVWGKTGEQQREEASESNISS